MSFVVTAVAIILRDLALVSLTLLFLWRNGGPVKLVGWTFRNGVNFDAGVAKQSPPCYSSNERRYYVI